MTLRRLRVRLATIGLGLALAFGPVASGALAAPAATSRSGRVPTVYHKNRSFRIPFNVDPAEVPRLKEVQLWVSDDSGFNWKTVSRTTPDRPSFTFRAPRDAEYWFAVRTVDNKGRTFPDSDEQVEPSMKVVVDTTPPSLVLEPDGRRGSVASVRWEVRDAHLDLASLVLEYQAEGAREWRQVPIQHPALIGSEKWDAGTAEPLKVRASVSDKARNPSEAVISMPEGTPNNPGLAATDGADFSAPPPISPISSGPSFPPIDESSRGAAGGRDAFPPQGSVANARAPFGNEPDPFGGSGATPSATAGAGGPRSSGGGQTMLIGSTRFGLQYAVEDAGPNGPATVELWISQDGGQHWSRLGEDPDRTSPFEVDLPGEGTFGLCLVARGASGLGDHPPGPGEPPQMWVEVDSTPPRVQLNPPVVGSGKNLGKVAISWRATDLHLAPRPVVLSWRPDQPGASWTPITPQPIENANGTYIWTVPPNLPPRFHLRVDVVDTVGNRGSAETTDMGPVIVDRARPRSRIIGLDPGDRTGAGPIARPLR